MNKVVYKKISYDPQADAMYVYASNQKIAQTIPVNDRVFIDIDKNGKMVGIEILYLSEPFNFPRRPITDKIMVKETKARPYKTKPAMIKGKGKK